MKRITAAMDTPHAWQNILELESVWIAFRARSLFYRYIPGSKVRGANMGPIWGRQDPGGPHVGPMNFAIWDVF